MVSCSKTFFCVSNSRTLWWSNGFFSRSFMPGAPLMTTTGDFSANASAGGFWKRGSGTRRARRRALRSRPADHARCDPTAENHRGEDQPIVWAAVGAGVVVADHDEDDGKNDERVVLGASLGARAFVRVGGLAGL